MIELLVGVAMLSIATYAIMQLSEMVSNQAAYSRFYSSTQSLDRLIKNQMQTESLCTGALVEDTSVLTKPLIIDANVLVPGYEGLPVGIRVANIRGAFVSDLLTENSATGDDFLPSYGLKFEQLRLSNFVKLPPVTLGADDRYFTTLEIQYNFSAGSGRSLSMKKHLVTPILVNVNPIDNRIKSCVGTMGVASAESTCSLLGGVMSAGACLMPVIPFDCGPGSVAVSVLRGVTYCEYIGAATGCPAGTYLSALSNGTTICRKY
jgi:hypothetical protein